MYTEFRYWHSASQTNHILIHVLKFKQVSLTIKNMIYKEY